jgi:RIO kinase 1
MTGNKLIDYFDDIDDIEEAQTQASMGARTSKMRQTKKQEREARMFVRAQGIADKFNFSFRAARFEEAWLLDSLVELAEFEWIRDVLRKAKAGKEASVYLCVPGLAIPNLEYVAAKVYRPRMLRNLKNDHLYREGRMDLSSDGGKIEKEADQHAIAKRSAYGEELRHQSWISHEYKAMQVLHEAGADIPRPYAKTANTILMDFIGDKVGSAPALNEVRLAKDEAQPLFDQVMHNVEIFLSHGYVHGDLSAYNILYWEGEIKLIDFPQVVPARDNRNAFTIFTRDVARVCEYFARQGVKASPSRLAQDLWTRHGFKLRDEIHPRLLDPEEPKDRRLWEKQK